MGRLPLSSSHLLPFLLPSRFPRSSVKWCWQFSRSLASVASGAIPLRQVFLPLTCLSFSDFRAFFDSVTSRFLHLLSLLDPNRSFSPPLISFFSPRAAFNRRNSEASCLPVTKLEELVRVGPGRAHLPFFLRSALLLFPVGNIWRVLTYLARSTLFHLFSQKFFKSRS